MAALERNNTRTLTFSANLLTHVGESWCLREVGRGVEEKEEDGRMKGERYGGGGGGEATKLCYH